MNALDLNKHKNMTSMKTYDSDKWVFFLLVGHTEYKFLNCCVRAGQRCFQINRD